MMTIATSQYRNVPRSCRSSTGLGAACSDQQLGPLRKRRLPINAPPFGCYDLLSHRIGVDQCARSTSRNSHTASAALKSP
jgi:hypothetical protein